MNEPKCRAPLPCANHVSSSSTAQIGLCRVQTTEFQNYVQVMFRPTIRSDKKYVERLNTIFISLCETFFHSFYVTDLRYDTIYVSWIKSCS